MRTDETKRGETRRKIVVDTFAKHLYDAVSSIDPDLRTGHESRGVRSQENDGALHISRSYVSISEYI